MQHFKSPSNILLILFAIFLVARFSAGFTEPSSPPPGSNTPAPLHVGAAGQTKTGGLILNTGGASYGLIVDQGSVGIGTQSPTQKLDVIGYIKGATGLCIGNDCRTGWPSGTVTSLQAGTGITLSPNPITTSGTIAVSNTCPGDMVKAGTDPSAFCIENSERGELTLPSAISTCRNAGKRLCTAEEYIFACTNSVASGMLNNYEWTSEISWQPNQPIVYDVALGPPDCISRSLVHATQQPRTYRCCSG